MQRGSIYWFLYESVIDNWRGNIHLVKGESSVELDSGKVSAEMPTSYTTMKKSFLKFPKSKRFLLYLLHFLYLEGCRVLIPTWTKKIITFSEWLYFLETRPN